MAAPYDEEHETQLLAPRIHHDGPTVASDMSAFSERTSAAAKAIGSASVQTRESTFTMPQYSSAGQFAFAPATQQTTVVTTTTTTVNLAPFVLQPARRLDARDPKQYPLAYTPTPDHMRNMRFKIGGQTTTFSEPEEPARFMGDYRKQQGEIKACNGTIKELEESRYIEDDHGHDMKTLNRFAQSTQMKRGSRATPPPSLAAAAELAAAQRRMGKKRSYLSAMQGVDEDGPSMVRRLHQVSQREADGMSTPDTTAGPAQISQILPRANDNHPQVGFSPTARVRQAHQGSRIRQTSGSGRQHEGDASSIASTGLVAATPPIMDSDVETDMLPPTSSQERASAAPAALAITSHQDASLPSPSLSPVTAAANARQRQLLSRSMIDNEDVSDLSGLENEGPAKRKPPPMFDVPPTKADETGLGLSIDTEGKAVSAPKTLMDVPDMISMYDSLPAALQSYVMFQLLKRSNKKTLRTVAEAVNPALKCDPFDTLPVELSLKINKYLDARTLAKAAQVSRRWRHLINSDETTWRELIDRDGFALSDGEIERAIREGWGWQYPGQHDFERDLSARRVSRSSVSAPASYPLMTVDTDEEASTTTTTTTTRSTRKRKAAGPLAAVKRQRTRNPSTPQSDDLRWIREIQKGQGPIAYASAAAAAVPEPKIGLASLKSLHLFKSIYQRHHMMRQTWMSGDIEPLHLAFRAHHRHVVTCLLFDSDRIITGSDDTSINVFDTKTGLLRKRLEGHEGGVWALSCDGDTLVSGSTDRSVRVWDIKTGQCMQTFQGHTSTVRCLVILKPVKTGEDADGNAIMHPNEPVIITGSRDSTLRVWKLPPPGAPQMHQAGPPENESDNMYALRTLTGHHNSVRAIAAHADTLVSGSYDCRVYVWRISTGELVHRLTGHSQKVYSVVLDHERNRCISGSMDNLVKVWSLESGVCLFTLEGHTSLVGLLELSHGHLVSAAADSTLRIWDPENGSCKSTLTAHTGAITCFQHDDQKVISGSDRTLKMWDIESGECARDLLTDLSGVWQVRFDQRRCVAAVQRNNLTYIEVLDFGASRDGVAASERGRRIVVDHRGREIVEDEVALASGEGVEVAVAAQ